ncbi:MAG: hypothetical protein KDA98_17745 [Acidimicrobiales bacterium]|nr:hypothetical protein [Acidimicrobiales bacterium]
MSAPSTPRRTLVLATPIVVALLVAGWLLWTRGDPARQGGYCRNATVEIAAVLRRADDAGDVGRGPLPPVERIFAELDQLDPTRFEVDTPPEVADEVAALRGDDRAQAFADVVEDYLVRCREAADAG